MAVDLSTLFAEVWAEYGLSMCAILLRFYARISLFGIRNLDIGDAFAFIAMLLYTVESTFIYLLSSYGNNVGLNEETAMALTDEQVRNMTLGSKLAVANWYNYICLIFALKGVLLTVYYKLGTGLARQEMLVKVLCIFTFLTWLGCILCHSLVCRPFHKGWQVKPYAGDDCTLRRPNYIWVAIFNALSDLAIILLPMPILFRVQVPLSHKFILMTLFSLGFFVIIATVLRAHYSLLSISTLPVALGWASRETFVATLVACAPGIKPLISRVRWFRDSSRGGSDKYSRDLSGNYLESGASFTNNKRAHNPHDKDFGIRGGNNKIMIERSVDVYAHDRGEILDEEDLQFELAKLDGRREWRSRYSTSVGVASANTVECTPGNEGEKPGTMTREASVEGEEQPIVSRATSDFKKEVGSEVEDDGKSEAARSLATSMREKGAASVKSQV